MTKTVLHSSLERRFEISTTQHQTRHTIRHQLPKVDHACTHKTAHCKAGILHLHEHPPSLRHKATTRRPLPSHKSAVAVQSVSEHVTLETFARNFFVRPLSGLTHSNAPSFTLHSACACVYNVCVCVCVWCVRVRVRVRVCGLQYIHMTYVYIYTSVYIRARIHRIISNPRNLRRSQGGLTCCSTLFTL